jgi:hypothetical protein
MLRLATGAALVVAGYVLYGLGVAAYLGSPCADDTGPACAAAAALVFVAGIAPAAGGLYLVAPIAGMLGLLAAGIGLLAFGGAFAVTGELRAGAPVLVVGAGSFATGLWIALRSGQRVMQGESQTQRM